MTLKCENENKTEVDIKNCAAAPLGTYTAPSCGSLPACVDGKSLYLCCSPKYWVSQKIYALFLSADQGDHNAFYRAMGSAGENVHYLLLLFYKYKQGLSNQNYA